MEGGFKLWKIQKIDNNSPHLDSYGKPLPSPPPGWYWQRLEDHSWELREFAISDATTVEFKQPTVIEHVVMSSDTLQGLCLRYRVSAVTLRQHNNFSGSNFKCMKYLRVAIEPGVPISIQPNSEDIIVQRFKNETGEAEAEAKCYLEESDWDLEKALSSWKGDEKWMSDEVPLAIPRGPDCIAPTAIVIPVAASAMPATGYVPPIFLPLSVSRHNEEDETSPLIH
jgi:hypothetical protein